MNHERYTFLQRSGSALTPAEQSEGWHYCHEWDGLLIHPGDPEHEACTCARTPPQDAKT